MWRDYRPLRTKGLIRVLNIIIAKVMWPHSFSFQLLDNGVTGEKDMLTCTCGKNVARDARVNISHLYMVSCLSCPIKGFVKYPLIFLTNHRQCLIHLVGFVLIKATPPAKGDLSSSEPEELFLFLPTTNSLHYSAQNPSSTHPHTWGEAQTWLEKYSISHSLIQRGEESD